MHFQLISPAKRWLGLPTRVMSLLLFGTFLWHSPTLPPAVATPPQVGLDDYDPDTDQWAAWANTSQEAAQELDEWIDHWEGLSEADRARAGFQPGFDRRGLDYRLDERQMYDQFAIQVLQRHPTAQKKFLEGLKDANLPADIQAKLLRSIKRLEPLVQAGLEQRQAEREAAAQAADQAADQTVDHAVDQAVDQAVAATDQSDSTTGQRQTETTQQSDTDLPRPTAVAPGQQVPPDTTSPRAPRTAFSGGEINIDPAAVAERTALPTIPVLPADPSTEKLASGIQIIPDPDAEGEPLKPETSLESQKAKIDKNQLSAIAGDSVSPQPQGLPAENWGVIQAKPGESLQVNGWQLIEPEIRFIRGERWAYWQVGGQGFEDGPEFRGWPVPPDENPPPQWVKVSRDETGARTTRWNDGPSGSSVEETAALVDWYRAGGQGDFYYDQAGNPIAFDPAATMSITAAEGISDDLGAGTQGVAQMTKDQKNVVGSYQGEIRGQATGTIRYEITANRQVTGFVSGRYDGSSFQGTMAGSIDPQGRLTTQLTGRITTPFKPGPDLVVDFQGSVSGSVGAGAGQGEWQAGNRYGAPTGTWAASRQ